MVSKNQLKLIKNLHQKKYRNEHGLFFVEGFKTVNELLNSDFDLFILLATKSHMKRFADKKVEEITEADLKKISALQSPNGILAVFRTPKPQPIGLDHWTVVLDTIRDPGNLGTIVRLCDWFGVKNLVCSKQTVDCFNPKVVQATMGSLTRVHIHYMEIPPFLAESSLPVYGAFIDGATIYREVFPRAGILVLGNEASGISPQVAAKIGKKVTIPQFGEQTTESLNVATAAGIILSEIRRRS